ncbi:hypothetical protein ACFYO1_04045 [Nocardia sp. NPDC006044]|uniref:hypothetical protein n=1 Tax=Nocardia sp. NPDC006044 TaxID=3364306 RepID=UPI0036A86228
MRSVAAEHGVRPVRTDEQMPTSTPASSAPGLVNAGNAAPKQNGVETTAPISITTPIWSVPEIPVPVLAIRWPRIT